jgi:hypothetical protein
VAMYNELEKVCKGAVADEFGVVNRDLSRERLSESTNVSESVLVLRGP